MDFTTMPTKTMPTKAKPIKTHAQLYPTLFEAIQLSGVYQDSKCFVDATPMYSPEVVLRAYQLESLEMNFEIADFVERHFRLPESVGASYQESSKRPVREHINNLWKVLARPADTDDPNSSLIALPNPYVVPGGRFREIYYWDSYFTMLGLMDSGHVEMVEAMIENFAYLIEQIGFIPNGNRSYFCTRSQPPFFALMIDLLAQTNDLESVYLRYLPQLEMEYAFWMQGEDQLTSEGEAIHRVVMVEGGCLNRYWDDSDQPRPESYVEDIELAANSKRNSAELYRDIRAACESGWDFTSRWFQTPDQISSIVTTNILPVDLNCLMHKLECTLAKAYQFSGQLDKQLELEQRSVFRKKAIQTLFYDSQAGIFVDLDIHSFKPTEVSSLACVYPLFFNLASSDQAISVAKILASEFLQAGGWLTTLNTTSQQWDSPNGWAPLQWICYQGLINYGFDGDAYEGASRWVGNNLTVYKATGKLVEKYNVIDLGLPAVGGEYEVQHGFGWTNGVLLKLMNELNL
jgi:alpha,alpha-trehalase